MEKIPSAGEPRKCDDQGEAPSGQEDEEGMGEAGGTAGLPSVVGKARKKSLALQSHGQEHFAWRPRVLSNRVTSPLTALDQSCS